MLIDTCEGIRLAITLCFEIFSPKVVCIIQNDTLTSLTYSLSPLHHLSWKIATNLIICLTRIVTIFHCSPNVYRKILPFVIGDRNSTSKYLCFFDKCLPVQCTRLRDKHTSSSPLTSITAPFMLKFDECFNLESRTTFDLSPETHNCSLENFRSFFIVLSISVCILLVCHQEKILSQNHVE